MTDNTPDTTASTPPDTSVNTPLPMRKEFSLTSAAKYLRIGTGTLRSKLKSGEIPHQKTVEGHYRIQGADLFQYEVNREADQRKITASTPTSTPDDTPINTPAEQPVSTPDGSVSPDLHRAVVDGLERELRVHRDTISRLENDVDQWRGHAQQLQAQSASVTRLLEHQQPGQDKRRRWWPW